MAYLDIQVNLKARRPILSTRIARNTTPSTGFTPGFIRSWFLAAVAFFVLASLLGALMRFSWIVEVPFLDYRQLLQAHSHLAMLGWGFFLLSGSLLFGLADHAGKQAFYLRIWQLNLIACGGMGIFYFLQGKSLGSQVFLGLHMLAACAFAWRFRHDLHGLSKGMPARLVRWSLVWMVVAFLGILGEWVTAALWGELHPLYFASIQFFLHFQFNGWFVYGVIALLFHYLAGKGSGVEVPTWVFWLLQLSLLLTYAQSITWSTPESVLFYLNSAGVITQGIAYAFLLIPVFRVFRRIHSERDIAHWLFRLGLICLMFKAAIQTAAAIPYLAEVSYTIRNLVIGFIHLTMLGAVSLCLLAYLVEKGLFPRSGFSKAGYVLLMTAFGLTELLLFGQGVMLWLGWGFLAGYYAWIFGLTALFPIAGIMVFGVLGAHRQTLLRK